MNKIETQKKFFQNHKAVFTDYGNIKILDFKNPDSNIYRIRFLFEEDYCRLHISGDLGELTATNYYNMTYEKFDSFVRDVCYFQQKIDCCNRPIYVYDEDAARDYLKDFFENHDLIEEITWLHNPYDSDEETCINDFLDDVLEDFSDESGLGPIGYRKLSALYDEVFEISEEIGRQETGILDLYLLAFQLAKEQLLEDAQNAENQKEDATDIVGLAIQKAIDGGEKRNDTTCLYNWISEATEQFSTQQLFDYLCSTRNYEGWMRDTLENAICNDELNKRQWETQEKQQK